MRICVVLLVAVIGATSATVTLRYVRSQWRLNMKPAMTRCQCQTGAKRELVDAFFDNGDFFDDPCFKCNFYCYGDYFNVVSRTGHVNADNWVNVIYALDHETAVRCSNFTELDLCEKTNTMVKCLHETMKLRYPP